MAFRVIRMTPKLYYIILIFKSKTFPTVIKSTSVCGGEASQQIVHLGREKFHNFTDENVRENLFVQQNKSKTTVLSSLNRCSE